jgi:cellulose synthase/poly-beta-1,6-N-acetylglucosamine synthase-like glycosyltransferase
MKRQRKILGIIGALITLVIPFFLMLHNENNHLETDPSLCPFKMVTGFPCLGCGITKSLVYFYQGDLYKSFYYHVLGPFLVLFCVVTIFVLSAELITKKEYFNGILYNKKLAYVLASFLICYQILRMTYFVENNTRDSILKESIWK